MLEKIEHFCVLVVDESLVIRGMLSNILDKDRDITVVGAAASAKQAAAMLKEQRVNIVTLDRNARNKRTTVFAAFEEAQP